MEKITVRFGRARSQAFVYKQTKAHARVTADFLRARATAAQARALLKKNKTNYKRGCVVVYIHIPWLFLQKNFFCLSMEKKIPFFIISQLVINLLHLLPSCFHTLRLFYLAINRWRSRKLYQKHTVTLLIL